MPSVLKRGRSNKDSSNSAEESDSEPELKREKAASPHKPTITLTGKPKYVKPSDSNTTGSASDSSDEVSTDIVISPEVGKQIIEASLSTLKSFTTVEEATEWIKAGKFASDPFFLACGGESIPKSYFKQILKLAKHEPRYRFFLTAWVEFMPGNCEELFGTETW